jgi:hypothetical protein
MNTAPLMTPAVLSLVSIWGLATAFDATISCDFPQTKPTSANEANSKKSVKTKLEDEQRNQWE